MAETDDDMVVDGTVYADTIAEKSNDTGVTIDGVLVKDTDVEADEVRADTISEKTGDAGVTIDGVLVKDNDVEADEVRADIISEKSADTGVTIDGVLVKDNDVEADEVRTDSILEKTGDAGVTIDGVLVKDNDVMAVDYIQTNNRELINSEPTQTAGTSPTVVISYPTTSGYAYNVMAWVVGFDSGGNAFAERISGTFKNVAGTLTQVGSTTTDHSGVDSAISTAFVTNVTTLEVKVTPPAATPTNWVGNLDIQICPIAV